MYWDLILRYETLILIFVRAHRETNFLLYEEVLEELIPLFFAFDHTNYARRVSVHIRDMEYFQHHVQCLSPQKTFQRHVATLSEVIRDGQSTRPQYLSKSTNTTGQNLLRNK